jgi:hypothetical protein
MAFLVTALLALATAQGEFADALGALARVDDAADSMALLVLSAPRLALNLAVTARFSRPT